MWHSFHGFIHDFQAIDKYLQTDFSFIKELQMKQYFFIRYWQGGPHIRLRVKNISEEQAMYVKETFETSIQSFIIAENILPLDKKKYYKHMTINNQEDVDDFYWCDNGNVKLIDYIPEIARYGGTIKKMKQSEELFMLSSEMAYHLNKLPYPKRLVVGLDLFLSTCCICSQNSEIDLSSFITQYRELWRFYQIKDYFLPVNKAFDTTIKKYIQGVLPQQLTYAKKYLSFIKQKLLREQMHIIFAHIHMTNNRLGLTPATEYVLASYILDCLKRLE